MLQAIGLTSAPHRGLPPSVDDLTFEAGPGAVTALLGAPGSGKTMALRLMLDIESGRGITYFRGRPLHRITHPAREVGVLLGDVPGHPARTARGQLRMLCAAVGVPASRADELLETVGLAALRDQRIGAMSVGMDRRLGLAAALLGDPHALILDDPGEGLSPHEKSWLHGLLRAHAARGGTVLYTTRDPKEAARTADRVVTVDSGRLVADQGSAAFSRTRLRPRVVVRTPHAARLAAIVSREARAAQRSVEVVAEAGSRLSVYGSSCAEIGDTAFRHGVPVHQLADEIGDTGPVAAGPSGPGAAPRPESPVADAEAGPGSASPASASELPPPVRRRPARGPLQPLRYELRRLFGVRTTAVIMAVVLVVSVGLSVLLARGGHTRLPDVLAAWPSTLPLSPVAFGAGVLGALSFGDEFRYPALAAGRGTVPRRIGLLLAKLLVSAGVAVLLALLTVLASGGALHLLYGGGLIRVPPNATYLAASWAGLNVGCAWAGLLAAGIFRVTAAGISAVLAVPVLVVPLMERVPAGSTAHSMLGLPARLRELAWVQWPHVVDRWMVTVVRMVTHPVGVALSLSLSVLICAYLFTSLRGRVRW
ncbi:MULTISPECIES: ATP-binding cassette domain-containing protein [unclassified Streptomyces]|uniref:ATP-binding cassette domain-containing protein n=1 Tax=unclassified Streptomyces TaxID=2593676 RepID=UPI002DDB7C9E|nr:MULTISPECIES: ATP-binding cassette domain-containing protein [unclassified Streptomyces]WSC47830.1 ATP-binding cassette domain-containing protein [Streptomyces sp. NBC_01762]WSD27482.1 ATP-binding cassette domain-containing protein [Streptomyces sp. NBC_01751]